MSQPQNIHTTAIWYVVVMRKLCKFEVLKLGQNLHADMEGFHRASHVFSMNEHHSYVQIQIVNQNTIHNPKNSITTK